MGCESGAGPESSELARREIVDGGVARRLGVRKTYCQLRAVELALASNATMSRMRVRLNVTAPSFGLISRLGLRSLYQEATAWDRMHVSTYPASPVQVAAGDIHVNPHAREWSCAAAPADVAEFHRGVPGYAPTPLHDLPVLASRLGVRRVLVKDESSRFGLPAFKALGVSYAVYRLICARAGVRPAGWDGLREVVATLPPLELVTATDGNHGRAVARFARMLGIPAHVFVPDVVSAEAIDAIRDEGAEVSVVAEDYDHAVRRAADFAESRAGAELLQDAALPGYEEVPRWVVAGYSTLPVEVDDQVVAMGADAPSLVVIPVGVGSFAQAVITHYRSGDARPALVGVEPERAACVQASRIAGEPVAVPTSHTIMTGLNCATLSSLAWPHLRDGLDAAVAVSEQQAADAVDELAALDVSSGPCGAATLAAMRVMLGDPDRAAGLGLSSDSTVVLLSTEGRPATPRARTGERGAAR